MLSGARSQSRRASVALISAKHVDKAYQDASQRDPQVSE
jgi:hypothetical protein